MVETLSLSLNENVEWTGGDPVPAERVIDGEPLFSTIRTVEQGAVTAGFWRCTPGRFQASRTGSDEVFTVIRGAGRVIADGSDAVQLAPGVVVVIRSGWSGVWEIDETIEKAFIITASS
ncbi:cupin domain-containing protein [Aeromicrobium yanjiei]|nr:cupin domain-containing protein [Aeromicrobium yanjiei]